YRSTQGSRDRLVNGERRIAEVAASDQSDQPSLGINNRKSLMGCLRGVGGQPITNLPDGVIALNGHDISGGRIADQDLIERVRKILFRRSHTASGDLLRHN